MLKIPSIPPIDYSRLARALEHYQFRGFSYLEVPWVISDAAMKVTTPSWVEIPTIQWGELVGSAEQSFIELMLAGQMPEGAHVAATPCWRAEEKFDELHLPYFMKVELIDFMPDDPQRSLSLMLDEAEKFFLGEVGPEIGRKWIGETCDIETTMGVELGSYGIRSFGPHVWVYGTGVAEPRTSQAIAMNRGAKHI
jgi:hypothetical protein